MADVVIGFVIQTALSKALSTIEEQIKLAWDFNDELKKLQSSLKTTEAFLRDAQRRQVDEPVKLWLEELGGVVRKADDVLDELAYEDLRGKVEPQMEEEVSNFFCQLTDLIPCLKKVNNFFSPSENPMGFTLIMAHEVKNIKLSMENINQQASELGLQQRVSTAAPVYSGVPDKHGFVPSAEFIGRKYDVKKIVGLLTAGSTTQQTLSIVSIVGMAGLGKTTLAKSVSKTEEVKNHFNRIIEVCVSENFDVHRILQEMVESLTLTGQPCGMKNRDAILEKIGEELRGKKAGEELKGKNRGEELEGKAYLLILDDVWDEGRNNWEALRSCLLQINEDNQLSCSILVTTRNIKVAVVGETSPENRHHLKGLKDDECWSIMKERAFKNSFFSPSISSKLEDIGREIARKCGGVPLIATVIGGTMSNNPNIDEWESIRDDPLWASLEKTNDWVIRVLKLSFDRLSSPSLKQCFAYCSIFPKNFNIQKEQLIQLWMAEGFLQQFGGSSQQAFEDIGSKYFDNLLSNSLLQDVKRDKYGCIETYKMHDLVHDLAQSISKAEIVDAEPNFRSGGLVEVKLWRSLFVTVERFQRLSSFKGLRVLKFIGASLVSLPDSISNLKLLRYFDISETDIGEVTESINKLYLLQTLRLLNCKNLEKLPQGMKNLVSLRHLCFNNERLVLNGIDGLTNLQTLPMFNVGGEGGCGIGELGNLSELGGELTIFNLHNVRNKEEAREAKLLHKKNLRKLKFKWNMFSFEYNNEEEVLEELEPHSNLKRLAIEGYTGVRIPSWLERKSRASGPSFCFQLIKLEELIFSNCHFLKNLPTLGLYRNLKLLKLESLHNVTSIGKEFCIDNSGCDGGDKLFPALETFSLERVPQLKEWLIEEEPTITVFPSLKELRISHCYRLTSVPMMSRFSSLEMLEIEKCSELCWTRDGEFPSTLKFLTIKSCTMLRYIPGVKGGISSLRDLTVIDCEELSRIEETLLASMCLRKVYIGKCPSLECSPLNGGSPSLISLDLYNCEKLEPSGLQTYTSLQRLSISKGTKVNLESFVARESLSYLTRLKILELGPFSEELEEFPLLTSIHKLRSSLQFLTLYGWEKLSSLPLQLQHLTALKGLRIEGFHGVKALPEWLGNFSSIQNLSIQDCSNMESFPEGESLGHLTHLESLLLGPFSKELKEFPLLTSIHNLRSSLKFLKLFGWEKLSSLPLQLQHLTELKTLWIDGFHGVKALPEWLGNFSSLQDLYIYNCKNMEQLPSKSKEAMQRLSNLKEFFIFECPLLQKNRDECRASKIKIYEIVSFQSSDED